MVAAEFMSRAIKKHHCKSIPVQRQYKRLAPFFIAATTASRGILAPDFKNRIRTKYTGGIAVFLPRPKSHILRAGLSARALTNSWTMTAFQYHNTPEGDYRRREQKLKRGRTDVHGARRHVSRQLEKMGRARRHGDGG